MLQSKPGFILFLCTSGPARHPHMDFCLLVWSACCSIAHAPLAVQVVKQTVIFLSSCWEPVQQGCRFLSDVRSQHAFLLSIKVFHLQKVMSL